MIKNTASNFQQRCYQALSKVPPGKVTTYSEIARSLGSRASRAVGTAMAKNRALITIPCHRVIRSDGTVGQYAMGQEKKEALLREEGIDVIDGKVVNLEQFLYRF